MKVPKIHAENVVEKGLATHVISSSNLCSHFLITASVAKLASLGRHVALGFIHVHLEFRRPSWLEPNPARTHDFPEAPSADLFILGNKKPSSSQRHTQIRQQDG